MDAFFHRRQTLHQGSSEPRIVRLTQIEGNPYGKSIELFDGMRIRRLLGIVDRKIISGDSMVIAVAQTLDIGLFG
jgi:hypothetical protein